MKIIQLVLPQRPLATEFEKSYPRLSSLPVTEESLLVKELDEVNQWTRLSLQLYFGWYAILLTMNSAGIGVVVSSADKATSAVWLERLVFGLFVGLNVLGIFVSRYTRRYMIQSHRRIEVILSRLYQNLRSGNGGVEPCSPIPGDDVITKISGLTNLGLVFFGLCWLVLTIWPQIRKS